MDYIPLRSDFIEKMNGVQFCSAFRSDKVLYSPLTTQVLASQTLYPNTVSDPAALRGRGII